MSELNIKELLSLCRRVPYFLRSFHYFDSQKKKIAASENHILKKTPTYYFFFIPYLYMQRWFLVFGGVTPAKHKYFFMWSLFWSVVFQIIIFYVHLHYNYKK